MSVNNNPLLKIPTDALTKLEAAGPLFNDQLIEKVNKWVEVDAPKSDIEAIVKSCITPTVTEKYDHEIFSSEGMDTLSKYAAAPTRDLPKWADDDLKKQIKEGIQFKKTNQLSLKWITPKPHPNPKILWFREEWEEELGHVPRHISTNKPVTKKDGSHCHSCKREFSIWTWKSQCAHCGNTNCSGCQELTALPKYVGEIPVPVGTCCKKKVMECREKDWLEPTGDPEIRKVITDTYLLVLAKLCKQNKSLGMPQVADQMYKDGLDAKVLTCLDLYKDDAEAKHGLWRVYAEKYIRANNYEMAMHCVERLVSFGKERTLNTMETLWTTSIHDRILRFMIYMKAHPDWFSMSEAIAESLSYKSYRITAYILKKQEVPIEVWVDILNSLPLEDATLFIGFMNDALHCDWRRISLNPNIDYLRWQYLNPKFDLSSWLNLIILCLKMSKRYRRFEDMVKNNMFFVNPDRFNKQREKTIESTLAIENYTMKDVEKLMQPKILPLEDGWYTRNIEPLKLAKNGYKTVLGVHLNEENDTFACLVGRGEEGSQLIDNNDFEQILSKGHTGVYFSLDQISGERRFDPLQKMTRNPESINTPSSVVAFLADMLLKQITTGAEINAVAPFALREADGYLLQRLPKHMRAEISRLRKNMLRAASVVNRFWIEAGEVECHPVKQGNGITHIFGDCKMTIKAHRMQYDPNTGILHDTDEDSAPDSPEAIFAKYLSDNYRKISKVFTVWARLEELVKIETVSRLVQKMYRDRTSSIDTSREAIEAELDRQAERVPDHYRRFESYDLDVECKELIAKDTHSERVHLVYQEHGTKIKAAILQSLIEDERRTIHPIVNDLKAKYHFDGDLLTPFKDWRAREISADPLIDVLKKAADDYQAALSARITNAYKSMNIALETDKTPIEAGCSWVPAAYSFRGDYFIYGGVNTMNTKIRNMSGPPPFTPPPPPQNKGAPLRPTYVEGCNKSGRYGNLECLWVVPDQDPKVHKVSSLKEPKMRPSYVEGCNIKGRFANLTSTGIVPGEKQDTHRVIKIKKMPVSGENNKYVTGVFVTYLTPNADPAKNVNHRTLHENTTHVHYHNGEAICINSTTGNRIKYKPADKTHRCKKTDTNSTI